MKIAKIKLKENSGYTFWEDGIIYTAIIDNNGFAQFIMVEDGIIFGVSKGNYEILEVKDMSALEKVFQKPEVIYDGSSEQRDFNLSKCFGQKAKSINIEFGE